MARPEERYATVVLPFVLAVAALTLVAEIGRAHV